MKADEFKNPEPTEADLALYDLEEMPLEVRARILNGVAV